jgi:hypothetical protein
MSPEVSTNLSRGSRTGGSTARNCDDLAVIAAQPLRLAAAALLALAVLAPSASAKTSRAKVIAFGSSTSCYATVPAEGRGIVCSSSVLKAGPKTHGLDPFLALKPHGRVAFGGRGDYGGYSVRRPTRMRVGDRWIWHGITCTFGKDGMSCLNRDDRGFTLGPTGYRPL